ncbi:hypothetical protein SAMN05421541_108416 [Actinoplanes philippinensis]|uniref:Uncharacterized protein n=1 Tax=Actinoplanes philippinensis TaxID=35752 RepID=A0A1I2HSA5_9ACTN|nr:hypothetical protein SAMN05421541_108416 [Actinoplanes philippinensis]
MGHRWWRSVTPMTVRCPVCEIGHGARFIFGGTPTRPPADRSPHDRSRKPGDSLRPRPFPYPPTAMRHHRQQAFGGTQPASPPASCPAGLPDPGHRPRAIVRSLGSALVVSSPSVPPRRRRAVVRGLWAALVVSSPSVPPRRRRAVVRGLWAAVVVSSLLVPRRRIWVVVRGLGAASVASSWSPGRTCRRPCRGVHRPTTRRAATGPRRRPVRRVTAPLALRGSTGGPVHRSGTAGSARRTGSLSGVLSGRRRPR